MYYIYTHRWITFTHMNALHHTHQCIPFTHKNGLHYTHQCIPFTHINVLHLHTQMHYIYTHKWITLHTSMDYIYTHKCITLHTSMYYIYTHKCIPFTHINVFHLHIRLQRPVAHLSANKVFVCVLNTHTHTHTHTHLLPPANTPMYYIYQQSVQHFVHKYVIDKGEFLKSQLFCQFTW